MSAMFVGYVVGLVVGWTMRAWVHHRSIKRSGGAL